MADETLRMRAEVEDRFSGPLKALRSQLLDTSRQGAAHGENLAKGLGKVEGAARSAGQAAQTVLNPALAMVGVTSLGTGVAVAGVVNALNSLGSSLSSLGQLGRETGMAADQLRIFQSVAGKFGVSGDASSAAAKTFSQNMRDIRRGVGETMGFLQSQNQVVAQFAIKLKGTTNNDEALKMTEQFLEQIPNAVDRGRFAEKLFGNMDLGRLGDKHLGAIRDLNAKTAEKLGPLDPKTVESAERYERALSNLRSSMQRVGVAIASELMVPAERFTSWMDDIASGKRKALIDGLRQGMHDIGDELGKIDWKAAGQSAEQMLTSTTMLVKPLAESVKEIAAAIKSFNEGKPAEAMRHLDGGSGPLARRLAPMLGDDEINAQENVDRLRKLRDVSNEASQHLIGRTQQRMGLIDSPEAAQQKLTAAEAELARLKGRTPEQRQKDFDASSERLRKSIDGLSEQLKSKQDATAQKSSLDADELFGGARVQAASLGGASVFGGPGGNRAEMRERFRQYLMRKIPGYDGGATVPTGPEGRISGVDGGTPRMPGIGGGSPMPSIGSGSGSIVTHGHRWTPGARTAEGKARVQSWLEFMQRPVDQGGVGADAGTARAMVGTMQGESGADLNPKAVGTVGEIGTAQWYKERANALRSKAAGMRVPWYDVGAQQQHFRDEVIHGRYRGVWQQMLRAKSEDEKMWIAIDQFESPKYKKKAFDFRLPNLRRLQQDAASGRMPGMPRPDVGQADGEGWASREKARKAFEAMQKGEGRLDASAARAGVVAGPKIENNGSVSVVVQRPGPETNVRTSASGNLFKDVVLQRGRTMAPAGG
ncbi:phage tail tip lysozyme [Methylobacterium sp. E-046]|uniref:phage tail tip lysozyme n=1 Tax=Methylobacterium sp. E-046 TaxID=2836576 RepID=UPI001FBBD84F|nr:phage tail tip lysozyme [Methylobacterium sp. E-046]MCJ2099189.1 phage tail tip lysozyme [Methylobacterium sp. E-046]